MSVLHKIACMRGRRDEVPNQILANELAESRDIVGIQEIVKNLKNSDEKVQIDCIKVLYEIGFLKPDLIARFVKEYIDLLSSHNSRLVWGGMGVLSTIVTYKAEVIWEHLDVILKAIKKGPAITIDRGISVLAGLASQSNEYKEKLFPILIKELKTCSPRNVTDYAEKTFSALDSSHLEEFYTVLRSRVKDLKPNQINRLNKIVNLQEE